MKAALCIGMAIVLWAWGVSADVVVRGDRAALDQAKLEALVRLELGPSTDIDELVIDVSAGHAAVAIQRRAGGSRSGVVALPAAGSGNLERTVALFVGELSRETEAPGSVPAERSSPTAPRADDTSKRMGASVVGGGSARMVGSSNALVLGPFLSGGIGVSERTRLSLVGRYGVTSADDPLGTIYVQIASAGANAAYRLVTNGSLSADTGPSLDVGWIGARGEGSKGGTSSGLGIAATWFVEARWSIARPLIMALGIEGGWLAPGLDLRADNRTVLPVSGALLGVSLGFGLAP